MEAVTEEWKSELEKLRREVRMLRAAGLAAVVGLGVFACARPGATFGAGGGPAGDRDNGGSLGVTAISPRTTHDPMTVRAPFKVVDGNGRMIAQIGRGNTSGAGYIETYNTAGTALTFTGSSNATGSGLVSANSSNRSNDAEARLTTDSSSGRLQTYNSSGSVNYSVP